MAHNPSVVCHRAAGIETDKHMTHEGGLYMENLIT